MVFENLAPLKQSDCSAALDITGMWLLLQCFFLMIFTANDIEQTLL
jgi:hypothetical protein